MLVMSVERYNGRRRPRERLMNCVKGDMIKKAMMTDDRVIWKIKPGVTLWN